MVRVFGPNPLTFCPLAALTVPVQAAGLHPAEGGGQMELARPLTSAKNRKIIQENSLLLTATGATKEAAAFVKASTAQHWSVKWVVHCLPGGKRHHSVRVL